MQIKTASVRSFSFLDIPFFLLGLNYILYNALSFDSLKMPLRISAIAILFFRWIIGGKYKIGYKKIIAILLATMSLLLNGQSVINFVVIVMFGICVEYPIKQIVRSAFRVNYVLGVLMIILMVTHVVENRSYVSTMGRLRSTLGFLNPNAAALFYSSAVYLYLASLDKIKKRHIVIASFFSGLIFYFTDSRTSFLATIGYILLMTAFTFFEKNNMAKMQYLLEMFSVGIVDFLFILNLVSVFFIEKFRGLDKLLSFRISSFANMINIAGWRGFFLGGTAKTVDNFYYMLLFQYGILIYLFVAVCAHLVMKKLVKYENVKLISLLVGLFMVALMESSLIRPEILVSPVVWSVLFAKDKELHVIRNKDEE